MPQGIDPQVQRLMDAGASDDDIVFFLKQRGGTAPTAPAMKAQTPYDEAKAKGIRMAMGDPERRPAMGPVATGAMLGGIAAIPATAGLSVPAAMGLATLAGAGGAGYGRLAQGATTGDFGTPTGNAVEMGMHGGLQGLGQGLASGLGAVADRVVPYALKKLINPSAPLQDRFPDVDIPAIARREQIPIGQSPVAKARKLASGQETTNALAARDASRPTVRGYLPPARSEVPLGPTPTPGDMPMRVSEAGALRLNRPPVSPTTGKRFAEFHPGDPEELLFSSRLESTGRPVPDLPSPEFGGPGVMYRPMPNAGGPGAPAQMIDPRELVAELGQLRKDLGNNPIPATAELDRMIGALSEARNRPLSLTEANAIKQRAQKLANAAFKAEEKGNIVDPVSAGFNKGVASGAQHAIERRAPEVIPMNQRTQELMALQYGLRGAEKRTPPIPGINPLAWPKAFPGAASRGVYAADNAATAMQSPPAAIIRQALLALLGGAMGEDDQ